MAYTYFDRIGVIGDFMGLQVVVGWVELNGVPVWASNSHFLYVIAIEVKIDEN